MKPSRLMVALAAGLLACAAFGNVSPKAVDRDALRAQLGTFLEESENGSTAFGSLSDSARDSILEGVDELSDQEAAKLHSAMSGLRADGLTEIFPDGFLDQVRKAGSELTALAPEAERNRTSAAALIQVLKLMPEEHRNDLGIPTESLVALEAAFANMSPLQAAVLQKYSLASETPLNPERALEALPQSVREAASILANRGPLSNEDLASLESYRETLVSALNRLDALPADVRARFGIEDLEATLGDISNLSPTLLVVLEAKLPMERVDELAGQIELIERVSKLTAEDRAQMGALRDEIVSRFAGMGEAGRSITDSFATMDVETFAAVESQMGNHWYTAVPLVYGALNDPDFPARLTAAHSATPNSQVALELEQFRAETLVRISASHVGPELVRQAWSTLQSASYPKLEFVRSMAGQSANPDDIVRVLGTGDFDCKISLGNCCGGFDLGNINLNFICKQLGDAIDSVNSTLTSSINTLSGTVNTLSSTVSAIPTQITNAVSAAKSELNATINSVQSTLNTTIGTVESSLNTAIGEVSSTVSSLSTTVNTLVNDISTTLTNLPGQIETGLTTAFKALLNVNVGGVKIGDIANAGTLDDLANLGQQALGMAGDWWNQAYHFTLPQIPCPSAGTPLLFGRVGESSTVVNYNRYKFVLDTIVGLIPDDVFSLGVKIPAQLLYAGFEYLGICLEDAADAADEEWLEEEFTTVHTGVTGLSTDVATVSTKADVISGQATGLAQQSAAGFTTTLNTVANAEANLVNQVGGAKIDINNQVSASEGNINQQVNTTEANLKSHFDTTLAGETTNLADRIDTLDSDLESRLSNLETTLTELIDETAGESSDLQLRIAIEQSLLGGGDAAIAMFVLPIPYGHYDLAEQIVMETLDGLSAVGVDVKNAQKDLGKAVEARQSGEYTTAYALLQKAYSGALRN